MDCIGIWVIRGCLGMEYGCYRDITPIKRIKWKREWKMKWKLGWNPRVDVEATI